MRRGRIFSIAMAVLSIVIVGGTIMIYRDTLTNEDYFALISPFVFMFLFWLFVKWMRKETGVKWVPWAP